MTEPTWGKQIECQHCSHSMAEHPWCANVAGTHASGAVKMHVTPPDNCPVKLLHIVTVGEPLPSGALVPLEVGVSLLGLKVEDSLVPLVVEFRVGAEHWHIVLQGNSQSPGLRYGAPSVKALSSDSVVERVVLFEGVTNG